VEQVDMVLFFKQPAVVDQLAQQALVELLLTLEPLAVWVAQVVV
jgi:predicted CoA-binding protein